MRTESSQTVIRGWGVGEALVDIFNGGSFVAGWVAEGGAIDGAGRAQETSSAARQIDQGRRLFFTKEVIRQLDTSSI